MLRFAPSPTGDMHIGNLRAAIFNYIIAKQRNEEFLIRIEDTDKERNIKDADREILQILTLFGLLWDKLVYQSANLNYHHQIAHHLLQTGKAFHCYCTTEFLNSKREEAQKQKKAFRYDDSWADLQKDANQQPVLRLRGANEAICFSDEVKGELRFEQQEIESFVILRPDGMPTYNFACAVDDMLYDVSFIVRGEDHTTNTPKQILIHKALDYPKQITFAHLPIILNEEGKKMSKREKSSSVSWLLEEGFLPQAIANYLIAMGNNPPTEVFTLQEAITWFEIKNIAKAPAKFDIKRLRFLNREHFKRISNQDLALMLDCKDAGVGELAKFYLQESSTLNELRDHIRKIFSKKQLDKPEWEEFRDDARLLYSALKSIIEEKHLCLADFESFKAEAMNRTHLKGKRFFKPLRILLTNDLNGPELSDLYPLIWGFLKDIVQIEDEK
ncbi:glutamate--tRNA ligase [Helicobacter monodelphidis]|uniref:glutamate--tRNA ligase n=1 Tax=Helicobacter sp. 15-1451 TaxID=2004995 RepID=UPI000DCBD21B|nr:glutamate--tRNA ligase [Helicobacter sp. 15-1451]RAX58650.1 glutamate--tRNA ligase [Helicobacter sp. 15-1451]